MRGMQERYFFLNIQQISPEYRVDRFFHWDGENTKYCLQIVPDFNHYLVKMKIKTITVSYFPRLLPDINASIF